MNRDELNYQKTKELISEILDIDINSIVEIKDTARLLRYRDESGFCIEYDILNDILYIKKDFKNCGFSDIKNTSDLEYIDLLFKYRINNINKLINE